MHCTTLDQEMFPLLGSALISARPFWNKKNNIVVSLQTFVLQLISTQEHA